MAQTSQEGKMMKKGTALATGAAVGLAALFVYAVHKANEPWEVAERGGVDFHGLAGKESRILAARNGTVPAWGATHYNA